MKNSFISFVFPLYLPHSQINTDWIIGKILYFCALACPILWWWFGLEYPFKLFVFILCHFDIYLYFFDSFVLFTAYTVSGYLVSFFLEVEDLSVKGNYFYSFEVIYDSYPVNVTTIYPSGCSAFIILRTIHYAVLFFTK